MENYFIYMFLNKVGEPLYIGQTQSLKRRIRFQHFTSSSHLNEDCMKLTNEIRYHICSCMDDMKIRERYLINTFDPVFNEKMNNSAKFSYDIKFQWKSFKFNHHDLLEKRNLSIENKQIKKLKNNICEIENHDEVNYCEIEDASFFKTVISYNGMIEVIKTNCYALMINNELYVRGMSNHHFFNLMYLINDTKRYVNRMKKEFNIESFNTKDIIKIKSKELARIKEIKGDNDSDMIEFMKFNIARKFINDKAIKKIEKAFLNITFKTLS